MRHLGIIPGLKIINFLLHNSNEHGICSCHKYFAGRILFYCNNLDLLPPKPKFTLRHLKKGIQEFHRRFVLASADKASDNVVVI